MNVPPVVRLVFVFATFQCLLASCGRANDGVLANLEKLLAQERKPFVIVEASGEGSVIRGQGVVISPEGHVLTAGHLSWDKANRRFADRFRVSFRGPSEGLPEGNIHSHKTIYRDREDAEFFERFYSAKWKKAEDSRFVAGSDLGLLTIDAEGKFPTLSFFSPKKPKIEIGDVFYLCHFSFPHKAGSPTLLVNPIEIVGLAQTTSGLQYLAKGYYRVGSSGGAILKDGRLIGIQSAAYTVNADGIGEIPMGLISFQPVWSELIDKHLESSAKPEPADQDSPDQDSTN